MIVRILVTIGAAYLFCDMSYSWWSGEPAGWLVRMLALLLPVQIVADNLVELLDA